MLELVSHSNQQEHVAVLRGLHFFVQLEPQLSRLEHKFAIQVFGKGRFLVWDIGLDVGVVVVVIIVVLFLLVFGLARVFDRAAARTTRITGRREFKGLGNVVQNDSLPVAIGFVAFELNILESFQISEVYSVEAVFHVCTPGVSFRFHHESKFQLRYGTHGSQVLVEPIQERNPRWNRHPLDVLVADPVNVLDERPDGVGV
mmetsp:Transcript_32388/g.76186  ORF Transcript_32388/g.76186 Transcript_32388/m.76186 type:complete len:201 (+) Transcript_32388:427-1029(+)